VSPVALWSSLSNDENHRFRPVAGIKHRSPANLLKQLADCMANKTERWADFRQAMPVSRKWAYFDHAAVAPLPSATADAIHTWCTQATEEGDAVWPSWNRGVGKARTLAAEMINAEEAEIALVPSTTAGISLVAEGFPWREGDNVVTLANEFPSNLYPWMNQRFRSVETRRVTVPPDGRVDLDRVLAACDHRTRIVSLSWIGFASGYRLDLPKFVDAVHQRGPYFFLDAIQGLGVFPLDVRQVPVDFLAADGHKWMLGPEGAGIFYLRQQHLDLLRPIGVGWNSVKHRYDFSKVDLDLQATAARYEGGTQNMAGFLGLAASLSLLRDLGLRYDRSPLSTRIIALNNYACERLRARGATIVSPCGTSHQSGILSFQLPGCDHDAIRTQCLQQGVILSHRGGCLRMSPHAYNNEADVDRLIELLQPSGANA
jgi:selenocysteine lyase/cysteine desulfurase